MKKILVQSFNDLHERRTITESNKLPKIALLFIFDLDENYFYYLTNYNGKLKDNKEDTIDYENNFINKCLKDSLPLSKQYFNELINTECNQFFIMNKNELLIKLGLDEYII